MWHVFKEGDNLEDLGADGIHYRNFGGLGSYGCLVVIYNPHRGGGTVFSTKKTNVKYKNKEENIKIKKTI